MFSVTHLIALAIQTLKCIRLLKCKIDILVTLIHWEVHQRNDSKLDIEVYEWKKREIHR